MNRNLLKGIKRKNFLVIEIILLIVIGLIFLSCSKTTEAPAAENPFLNIVASRGSQAVPLRIIYLVLSPNRISASPSGILVSNIIKI